MSDNNGDMSAWPTKDEAAAALSRSTKTVERLIARGAITARYRSRNGAKPETICDPRDIERLQPTLTPQLAEREQPTTAQQPPGTILGGLATIAAQQHAIISGLQRDTATLVSILATLVAPRQHQLWLTVKEAAALSGLSRRHLTAAIQSGALAAIRDGRSTKISRKALENYAAQT